MNLLKNIFRKTLFLLKLRLRIRNPAMPVIWGRPKLASLPSEKFINTLSTEDQLRLNNVIAEVKMLSRCYRWFPDNLNDNNWKRLLECHHLKQRLDQLRFWHRKGKLKEKDLLKAETNRKKLAEKRALLKEKDDDGYSFLFLPPKKLDRMMKRSDGLRYWHSLVVEPLPALAIDCQFLKDHSPRGLSLAFVQLKQLIAENRRRSRPWPLYFCNANFEDYVFKEDRQKHLQVLDSTGLIPVDLIPENFMEFLTDYEAVYLSPHAEEELLEVVRFSIFKIFIIGGIVDRVREIDIHPHASLIAAKGLGIPVKKLPLDRYIKWKSGTKSLTLTAVSNILNDVYTSRGDWQNAFKQNIPMRNIRDPSEKSPYIKARYRRIHDYEVRVLKEVKEKLYADSFSLHKSFDWFRMKRDF